MIYLNVSMMPKVFLLSYITSVVVYVGSMAGKYSIKHPLFLKKMFYACFARFVYSSQIVVFL